VRAHAPRAAAGRPGAEGWSLCLSGTECAVVYFRGGEVVAVEEVRTAPFHKQRGPDRTVCFCFGHKEEDVRRGLTPDGQWPMRAAIAESCRSGKSDCESENPSGHCCLGDVARIIDATAARPSLTTLDTLERWVESGERFPVFTCYDATTARWLARGGARVMLVGDSAAQLVLGLSRSEKASLDFMATIGAAVRRGAPSAFVIVDYPDDLVGPSRDHAARVLQLAAAAGASAIKVEGDAGSLRELLRSPGMDAVPVVAHLAASNGERCSGQPSALPSSDPRADERLLADALSVCEAGARAVLLQAVPPAAADAVVLGLSQAGRSLPVLGCHAGPACHGQVEMLHLLLGLEDAPRASANVGEAISAAAHRRVADLSRR
jgi:3-methyl-2-oxobutanoate hydroxymethyltransferase